jgi:hypothetical protein
MRRALVSALAFNLALPFTVLAQERMGAAGSGQKPLVGGKAPTVPVRPVTKEAVGIPGLFSAEMDLVANPSLSHYQKKMKDRNVTVLDATPVEGGGLTRVVLYISNREQLGQAQYDLNSRLTPMDLPRPVDGKIDTDYNRLQQTSTRAVYARLYFDAAIAESGKIQESFQAFKQQVNAFSVQFTAILDADGKKISAKRANNQSSPQYTLPFQGAIEYPIKDLRDAYRFQMMVSACAIAERVELIEPQQQTPQGQQRQADPNNRVNGQSENSTLGGQYQNGSYQNQAYGSGSYPNGNYPQASGNAYYNPNQPVVGNGYGRQPSLRNGGYGQQQHGVGNTGYPQSPQGMQQGFFNGNSPNDYNRGTPFR